MGGNDIYTCTNVPIYINNKFKKYEKKRVHTRIRLKSYLDYFPPIN